MLSVTTHIKFGYNFVYGVSSYKQVSLINPPRRITLCNEMLII